MFCYYYDGTKSPSLSFLSIPAGTLVCDRNARVLEVGVIDLRDLWIFVSYFLCFPAGMFRELDVLAFIWAEHLVVRPRPTAFFCWRL